MVAIISPHSSNFDALYAFLAMLGVGMRVTVLGKANLFKIPFSVGFKWIGIILVQRDSAHGLTQQVLNILQAHAKIWIVLAPEGTRNIAEKMKNVFSHIALNAQIPSMVFAFDYNHSVICSLAVIYASGNYETDLAEILSHAEGQFSPKILRRFAQPLQKLFKNR